jgi:hypothetical protein
MLAKRPNAEVTTRRRPNHRNQPKEIAMASKQDTRKSKRARRSQGPLAVVTSDRKPRRVEFVRDGFSLLGDVPALVVGMPLMTYDPTLGRHRLAIDEHGKGEALEEMSNSHYAVTRAIKLIGMLMAGQSREFGYIGDDEIAELGFALHGLAHMAEQLVDAVEQIAQAVPAVHQGKAANG